MFCLKGYTCRKEKNSEFNTSDTGRKLLTVKIYNVNVIKKKKSNNVKILFFTIGKYFLIC